MQSLSLGLTVLFLAYYPGRAGALTASIKLSHSTFARRITRCRSNLNHQATSPHTKKSPKRFLSMLRNFDLPETLIFYGIDAIIDTTQKIRPGVLRLIEEAIGLDIPSIILSESLTMNELAKIVEATDPSGTFLKLSNEKLLHYRSSLEEFIVEEDAMTDDEEADVYIPFRFVGKGVGHAPCPAALYDAINTITISPKGFGGSAGFGVKNWEAGRIPLPQHCVVFVCSTSDRRKTNVLDRSDGSGSISRDRCISSRYCGMRTVYIEDEGMICTAEHVADAIVESLGTEEDWEMITIDDISTPGSFWLNMMQPKDADGYRISTEDIIEEDMDRRSLANSLDDSEKDTISIDNEKNRDVPDEEDIAKMLADLDSL